MSVDSEPRREDSLWALVVVVSSWPGNARRLCYGPSDNQLEWTITHTEWTINNGTD